jgi:hypothetical protein
MTPGMLKSLLHFPGFAVDPTGKEAKQSRPNGKALESAAQSLDLVRRLFYATGIIPSDGGAKQLSQRGNAELVFGSGAVSLNGF